MKKTRYFSQSEWKVLRGKLENVAFLNAFKRARQRSTAHRSMSDNEVEHLWKASPRVARKPQRPVNHVSQETATMTLGAATANAMNDRARRLEYRAVRSTCGEPSLSKSKTSPLPLPVLHRSPRARGNNLRRRMGLKSREDNSVLPRRTSSSPGPSAPSPPNRLYVAFSTGGHATELWWPLNAIRTERLTYTLSSGSRVDLTLGLLPPLTPYSTNMETTNE